MQKGIRKSGLLLLGIAGLIFVLHSVIPHHHHYNSIPYNSHQTNNNHSGDSSRDCHAFNDLAVDKVIIPTNNNPFLEMVPAIIPETIDNISFTVNLNGCVRMVIKNDSTSSLVFLQSFPTRGSPLSV